MVRPTLLCLPWQCLPFSSQMPVFFSLTQPANPGLKSIQQDGNHMGYVIPVLASLPHSKFHLTRFGRNWYSKIFFKPMAFCCCQFLQSLHLRHRGICDLMFIIIISISRSLLWCCWQKVNWFASLFLEKQFSMQKLYSSLAALLSSKIAPKKKKI